MNTHTNNNGFTLIEVLVAIAIFGIGMLAVGAMQIQATNSNTRAAISTELTAFAEDQMEKLTRLSFDDFREEVNLITGVIVELTPAEIDSLINLSLNANNATQDGRFEVNCSVEQGGIIDNTLTVTLQITDITRTNELTLILQHIIPRV